MGIVSSMVLDVPIESALGIEDFVTLVALPDSNFSSKLIPGPPRCSPISFWFLVKNLKQGAK